MVVNFSLLSSGNISRLGLIVCVACTSFSSVSAETCVRFDVPQVAAMVEQEEERPNSSASITDGVIGQSERLVRFRVPISALVHANAESRLTQFVYVISGPSDIPFQIVGFSPQTSLQSTIASNVAVEDSSGQSANIGLTAVAPTSFPVRSDADVSLNSTNSQSLRFDALPPQQLLLASGTMRRGRAVYFKLKPSPQTTLEGAKTFEVTARVPVNFRAGWLTVQCSAFRNADGGKARSRPCSGDRFVVGIYNKGDQEARERVWQMAQGHQSLQAVASQHSRQIEKQRWPSWGHKLGDVLSITKPKIPDHWLEKVLVSDDYHGFERHLPRDVRRAVTSYRQARRAVQQLRTS